MSIDPNLGLLQNKVAYILATRELIHLRCTTYARELNHCFLGGYEDNTLAKPCLRFAYICLDNVKCISMQNIQCGSRVMSIFTKSPPPASMMLGKHSSGFCIPVARKY